MFSADTAFQLGVDGASFFNRYVHQLPHALTVNRGKRVVRQDFIFHVFD
jgi:hypothetical protein